MDNRCVGYPVMDGGGARISMDRNKAEGYGGGEGGGEDGDGDEDER